MPTMTKSQLLDEIAKFRLWAETAEGCDWCCGGGDEWFESLTTNAAELGFASIEAFVAACE